MSRIKMAKRRSGVSQDEGDWRANVSQDDDQDDGDWRPGGKLRDGRWRQMVE